LIVILQAESPLDATNVNIRGLLLSSYCLERNSEKMFELWSDLFNGAFKFSARNSSESSLESLVLRLGQLINMSAVDAVNGMKTSFLFRELQPKNTLVTPHPPKKWKRVQMLLERLRPQTNLLQYLQLTSYRLQVTNLEQMLALVNV
jgi:hypothetical protein